MASPGGVQSIRLGSKDLGGFKGPTYNVQDDVEKLTKYFDQRWGSLEKAQNALGWDTLEQEYDILQFEHLLRSWGVKVDSVTDLFDQIDMDYSGKVSVRELFDEIARPLEELQEREKQRKDNERDRMYDAFAEGIQRTYGSIEDAFKALAPSTEQELSVAQFMNLTNKLQVDLSVAQLHRAFDEIDKDGGAKISLSELKEALESHLVKKSLVAVAAFLVENHGSIEKPLEDLLGDAAAAAGQEMSARSSLASPLGEKKGFSNFSPGESGMLQDRSGSLDDMQEAEKQEQAQEQRMLRALRKLQVVPRAVREEACKALLRSLRSQGHLTLDKFKECLQAEHEKNAIEEKRKKMDADHREKLSQKALKRALRTDNKRAVQEQVAEWATRAQQGGPGVQRAEDVTRRCVQEARAAMARTQLKDYVDELRNHLESRQGELFKLQSEAEEEARLVGDFFPMGPMQTPPASVARRRGLGGMFGVADPGDTSFENRPLTPDTPATPYTTGSRTPMTVKSRTASKNSLRPESKAKRAEQLVQAAASGDVAALQRLLGGDADPNAVGWSGATPLMAAAHHGREAAIDLLVLMGADVLRTDVRGRTALDHAYRRPSTRERLRAYGAMTGSDLERRAQDLARRVLQVEQERAKLEAQLSQLPSKEVRERQIALQHRSVSGLLSPPTLNSPRRRTRSTPSMLNVSVDEYNEGDAVAAPQAPPEMTRAASAPTPSIETGLPASALARRSPHDSAKKDKQTRIVLPVKQRGEA